MSHNPLGSYVIFTPQRTWKKGKFRKPGNGRSTYSETLHMHFSNTFVKTNIVLKNTEVSCFKICKMLKVTLVF